MIFIFKTTKINKINNNHWITVSLMGINLRLVTLGWVLTPLGYTIRLHHWATPLAYTTGLHH